MRTSPAIDEACKEWLDEFEKFTDEIRIEPLIQFVEKYINFCESLAAQGDVEAARDGFQVYVISKFSLGRNFFCPNILMTCMMALSFPTLPASKKILSYSKKITEKPRKSKRYKRYLALRNAIRLQNVERPKLFNRKLYPVDRMLNLTGEDPASIEVLKEHFRERNIDVGSTWEDAKYAAAEFLMGTEYEGTADQIEDAYKEQKRRFELQDSSADRLVREALDAVLLTLGAYATSNQNNPTRK